MKHKDQNVIKKKKKRGGTLPQITNTEETSEMLAAA